MLLADAAVQPHSPIDVVNLIAVVLGVLFSIRRNDISRRTAAMYPEVPEADFQYWKTLEKSGWGLAAVACVIKIVADLVFQLAYAYRPGANFKVVFVVGFSIFLSWVVALVVSMLRARKGRIVRLHLGIDIHRPIPQG